MRIGYKIFGGMLLSICSSNFGVSPATAESFISLFDGKTLNGWQTVQGGPVTQGWEVVDGTIHLRTDGPRGGNLVTTQQFGDFELQFEWKIKEKGNNGLKYRVREFDGRVLGCEFQILGANFYPDSQIEKSTTGSLYDMYEPTGTIYVNGPEEFNHSRIISRGNCIQHWLNGERIVCAQVGSCDWYQRKSASKFSAVDGFGENRVGRIMLTDHSSEVWYRNITLRKLGSPPRCKPRFAPRLLFRRRHFRSAHATPPLGTY